MEGALLEMKNEAFDEAVEMIRAKGFKPHITRNRHWKIDWIDQRGQRRTLVMGFSPSDWRARWNIRARLRRLLRG
jgi:hypothetical protein